MNPTSDIPLGSDSPKANVPMLATDVGVLEPSDPLGGRA